MIKLIEIEKLHPHPDNPRKNIGDVTELAESIKQSGVLQNLTVVPCTGYYHGDYTVIIGHRRLAASKHAGLKELPCAIIDMSEKEQIATMLLENMQRCDLTVYEQAQGMQMMLDLGDTIADISEKTGFSESTIRRRTKLLKLDEKAFRDSQERQVTLEEYDRLFEIENESERNKLLEDIGTGNFNNKFLAAKSNQEYEKKRAELIAALSEFAEEKKDSECRNYRYVGLISKVSDIPKERENLDYFYYKAWGSSVYLYRDFTDEEKAQNEKMNKKREEEKLNREKRQEIFEELNDLAERFYLLRYEFIKNCSQLRKRINILCEFAAWSLTLWNETEGDMIETMCGIKLYDEEENYNEDVLCEYLEGDALRGLLYIAYIHTEDSKTNKYHDFYGKAAGNDNLDRLYKYLCDLGYEMSDEEKAYQDGTHKLFEV